MTLDEVLRTLVRDEVRRVLREEALPREREPDHADEFMTVKGAAAMARVSIGTVRSWISKGLIRVYGEGRVLRVRRDEFVAAIQHGHEPHAAPVSPQDAAAALLERNRSRSVGGSTK